MAVKIAWQAQANCLGLEWFIEDGQLGLKREVCHDCPVKAECLAFALENEDVSPVVYGGTTGNARKKMLGL